MRTFFRFGFALFVVSATAFIIIHLLLPAWGWMQHHPPAVWGEELSAMLREWKNFLSRR